MRRGTTPTLKIKVNGADLSKFSTIYITIKQPDGIIIEKKNDDLTITEDEISITLSQDDTLKFNARLSAYIQLRAIDSAGLAIASDISEICVDDILKEGVI